MTDLGFAVAEHRLKQVANSLDESRHVLAEIEDNLHTTNQLRRGESDKIAEVDSEFLRCSSSIQAGWDRITRFKGKAVIATDDSIISILDNAFDNVEDKLYRVLLDALTNDDFLDYGSLIAIAHRECAPLLDALKDLVIRLRGPGNVRSPLDATPPSSGSDRPNSRSQPRSVPLRTIRDPTAALGASRYDQQGPQTARYDPLARNGSALNPSTSYADSPEPVRPHETHGPSGIEKYQDQYSFPTRSPQQSESTTQRNYANSVDQQSYLLNRPPPLVTNTSQQHSAGSQGKPSPLNQDQLPDPDLRSLHLSPVQVYSSTRHSDSRNGSTSDDGALHGQAYGSSWKSSSIATSDTIPSPVSPMFSSPAQIGPVNSSNMGQLRGDQAKHQLRETKIEYIKRHESIEQLSPHTHSPKQIQKKRSDKQIGTFGPPPGPPPERRLPEPPRPPKISLLPIPVRKDQAVELGSASSTSSTRSIDGGVDVALPIQIQSGPPSFQQQGHIGTLPERGLFPRLKFASHGMKYPPPPPTSMPNFRPEPPMFNRYEDIDIPPRHPARTQAPEVVDLYIWDDDRKMSSPSAVKELPSKPHIIEIKPTFSAPRASLAPTASSEGTIRQEKYICVSTTVKQVTGLATPAVELVPSKGTSTRPADNLPNDTNKYWTLCKQAYVMQTGDGKKTAEEVAIRPLGITGNEKYMKCRKCKYEYGAYTKATGGKPMTDPRWRDGPNGLRYRETLLFKSHIPSKKDKLPQEEYRFGCIFCAATGHGMPVFIGKTSLLAHLVEHGNGNYPNEVIKTRIKFTTSKEFDPLATENYFELVLP